MAILPNMRLLALPSEALGEDWQQKSRELDEFIQEEGFDLAEEAVFLMFNRSPGSIQHGEGACLIARSVIGPKKAYPGSVKVVDWKSASVYQAGVNVEDWESLFQQAVLEWEKLQKENRQISSSFFIKLSRRLDPELVLYQEIFFHE